MSSGVYRQREILLETVNREVVTAMFGLQIADIVVLGLYLLGMAAIGGMVGAED